MRSKLTMTIITIEASPSLSCSPAEMTSLQFWLLQKQILTSTSTCFVIPLWSITSTAWKHRFHNVFLITLGEIRERSSSNKSWFIQLLLGLERYCVFKLRCNRRWLNIFWKTIISNKYINHPLLKVKFISKE